MSFERIQDRENKIFHEREAVLAYHFSPAEQKQLLTIDRKSVV